MGPYFYKYGSQPPRSLGASHWSGKEESKTLLLKINMNLKQLLNLKLPVSWNSIMYVSNLKFVSEWKRKAM